MKLSNAWFTEVQSPGSNLREGRRVDEGEVKDLNKIYSNGLG